MNEYITNKEMKKISPGMIKWANDKLSFICVKFQKLIKPLNLTMPHRLKRTSYQGKLLYTLQMTEIKLHPIPIY